MQNFFWQSHIRRGFSLEYMVNTYRNIWMIMRFIRPTSLNNRPNSIQIAQKLCETFWHRRFAFVHSCDLEWRSRLLRQISTSRVHKYLPLYQVWTKSLSQSLNACQHFFFFFLDTVSKTAAISLNSLTLTQKYQYVQLQHNFKFHPDQLKTLQENEANRSCSALTLWAPAKLTVTQSHRKQSNIRSQWCIQVWQVWKYLVSNVKAFATKDSQLACCQGRQLVGQTQLITYIHMLLKWLNVTFQDRMWQPLMHNINSHKPQKSHLHAKPPSTPSSSCLLLLPAKF